MEKTEIFESETDIKIKTNKDLLEKEAGVITEYYGIRKLQDLETGEILDVSYTTKRVKHALKKGWRRVYLNAFLDVLLDITTDKKVRILEFIIDNLDSENKLGMTIQMVSKHSQISYKTTHLVFKELGEKGIIRKVGTNWIMNPNFICAIGSDRKNLGILQVFKYGNEYEQSSKLA